MLAWETIQTLLALGSAAYGFFCHRSMKILWTRQQQLCDRQGLVDSWLASQGLKGQNNS